MLLSSFGQAKFRAGTVRRFASGKFSTRGWMWLAVPLRLNCACAEGLFADTRHDRVTRGTFSHRVAVAAAGEPAGLAKTQIVKAPPAPFSSSPLIELSLIIYGRGVKRNKQLSRLRPDNLLDRDYPTLRCEQFMRRVMPAHPEGAQPACRGEAESVTNCMLCG